MNTKSIFKDIHDPNNYLNIGGTLLSLFIHYLHGTLSGHLNKHWKCVEQLEQRGVTRSLPYESMQGHEHPHVQFSADVTVIID